MLYDEQKLDVTTLTKGVILHGVNCQGAMGSGIAGAIARKWPRVREEYLKLHKAEVDSGARSSEMLGMVQWVAVSSELCVVNCFTQDYFGGDGKRYASPEAIEQALTTVFDGIDGAVKEFAGMGGDIEDMHVYMPQIGCGLGGLSWVDDVKPIVDRLAVGRTFPITIVYI